MERAQTKTTTDIHIYFSDYFGVGKKQLRDYGAFDISIVSDLPLFIDPFLLFNSEKPEYQKLHQDIIDYLVFLRDKATDDLEPALVASWYRFKEVKQNWLGFTVLGNGGHALGRDFAESLHGSLNKILKNFGEEQITSGSHLEKLCLIKAGVGRDSISDFTTNLIKHYLLEYTQEFARTYLSSAQCQEFAVTRAMFNYSTQSWVTKKYYLPKLRDDYVLLTPIDMLTCDDTWISSSDLVRQFAHLPEVIANEQLRAQVGNYFKQQLSKKPTSRERTQAIHKTILEYPELVDYYIRLKENNGEAAEAVSLERVEDIDLVMVDQIKAALEDVQRHSTVYEKPWTSYEECLERVAEFKHYVEDCDGYRVMNRAGKPFSQEKEVQLFFGLIWCKTDFDVNREPNNGRGPVDFKVSYGSKDKSLIEFKLASNTSIRRNLENQVRVYEKANGTRTSVKVIICYTAQEQESMRKILLDLGLDKEESVVIIDARNDNKPSASTV